MGTPTDLDSKLSREVAGQWDAIHRFVFSIVRDSAAADDLTQETLLRAHRKLETLDEPGKLTAWLYRIATNLCRDRFRGASYRHRPRSLDAELEGTDEVRVADLLPDTAPRLDKAMEQKEMSACVQDYLSGLPDPYRAAILLHDVAGLTNPEIARMLGITLPTVKIRLHRAREKLRATLAEACSFSTDERGVFVCDRKPPKPSR